MPVESLVACAETVLVPVGRPDVEPVPEFFTVPRTLTEARRYAVERVGDDRFVVSNLIASGAVVTLEPWRTPDDIVAALYDLTITTTAPQPEDLACAFAGPDGADTACPHRVAGLLWGPGAHRTVGEWLAAPANDEVSLFDLIDELVAALPCLLAAGAYLEHPAAVVTDLTGESTASAA